MTNAIKPLTAAQLGKIYENVVGYDIHEDGPLLTADEILSLMAEYDKESGETKFATILNLLQ